MPQIRRTIMSVFLAGSALAQTTPPVAFDVASIKQLREDDRRTEQQTVEASPGILTMRNVTVKTMVKWAYRVEVPQISGPAWIDSQRYDILARASRPANDAEMRHMVQTLLAERFKLAAHRENKQMTVLMLAEAKGGHKMKQSEGDGPAKTRKDPTRGLVIERISMAELAEQLAEDVRTLIVDMTGLTGRYDFELNVAAYLPPKEAARTGPLDPLDIMQTALQKELGLRLQSRKSTVEILIIDHLEKEPTEN